MKWTEAYEHAGWTVTVPIKLIRAIGVKGAVFVSRLFYWKGKQKDPDGWIYKTKVELEEETGLATWEQDTCTANLKKKGILETKYDRLDHRLYYRIHDATLNRIMEADSPGQIGNHDFGKSANTGSANRKSLSRESMKSDFVIRQENTTKDTAKKTTTTNGNGSSPVVVALSVFATEDEAEFRDTLRDKFELTDKQARMMDDQPIDFLREQVRIILSEPRKNLAGCLVDAVQRGGWKSKRSYKPAPKSNPRASIPEPQTELSFEERQAHLGALKAEVAKV